MLTDKRVLQDNRNYLNQTAESFRTFGLDPKVPNLPAGRQEIKAQKSFAPHPCRTLPKKIGTGSVLCRPPRFFVPIHFIKARRYW